MIAPRNTIIKYVEESNGYDIMDLQDGAGTYIKIEAKFKLENGNVIYFGESFIQISIKEDDDENSNNYIIENIKLTITFIEGPRAGEEFTYSSKNTQYIKVGRSEECDITLNSDLVPEF